MGNGRCSSGPHALITRLGDLVSEPDLPLIRRLQGRGPMASGCGRQAHLPSSSSSPFASSPPSSSSPSSSSSPPSSSSSSSSVEPAHLPQCRLPALRAVLHVWDRFPCLCAPCAPQCTCCPRRGSDPRRGKFVTIGAGASVLPPGCEHCTVGRVETRCEECGDNICRSCCPHRVCRGCTLSPITFFPSTLIQGRPIER